jgi:hypothetical protein
MDSVAGQDGHCGNFNGNGADDDTSSIKQRMSEQVAGEDLLFPGKNITYIGCFVEDPSNRDLPTSKGGPLSLQACSRLCSGFTYFGRSKNQECWCGNNERLYNELASNQCDCRPNAVNQGGDSNCVYTYYDAQSPPELTLADCPADTAIQADTACRAAMPDTSSQEAIDACVLDYCFAGEDFADQSGEAAEQEQEAKNERAGWPACILSDIRATPSGSDMPIEVDLTPYGASTGCGGGDCTSTGSFFAATADVCALSCYAVAFCRVWSYNKANTGDPSAANCFLWAENTGRTQDVSYDTGLTTCHPTGYCDNRPSAQMLQRGAMCETYPNIARGTLCGNNANWRTYRYCRYQCWLNGFAYDGESCSAFS